MPDREKVIKGLEHCFHGQECCGDTECPYFIEHLSDSCCLEDCQENLKADALAMLKKHEPRKAEYVGRNGVMSWECPQCKNLLDMFCNGEFVNYCCYCGQKVVF